MDQPFEGVLAEFGLERGGDQRSEGEFALLGGIGLGIHGAAAALRRIGTAGPVGIDVLGAQMRVLEAQPGYRHESLAGPAMLEDASPATVGRNDPGDSGLHSALP
jgi:hypothetical protein